MAKVTMNQSNFELNLAQAETLMQQLLEQAKDKPFSYSMDMISNGKEVRESASIECEQMELAYCYSDTVKIKKEEIK